MPPARIYEGGAEWPSYSTATAICSRGRTALVLKQHRNIGSILHSDQGIDSRYDVWARICMLTFACKRCLFVT